MPCAPVWTGCVLKLLRLPVTFLLLSAPCVLDLMFSSTLGGRKLFWDFACQKTLPHFWQFDWEWNIRFKLFFHRILNVFPHCPLIYRVAVKIWCSFDFHSLYICFSLSRSSWNLLISLVFWNCMIYPDMGLLKFIMHRFFQFGSVFLLESLGFGKFIVLVSSALHFLEL